MSTTLTGTRPTSTQQTQRTDTVTPQAPAAQPAPAAAAPAAAPAERTPATAQAQAAARELAANQPNPVAQRLSGAWVPAPSLDAVRSGTARIARGQGGESVAQMQQRLNEMGARPPLEVDGKFGPRTQAAVQQYQASRGITDTGVIGQQTLRALDSNAPAVQRPAAENPGTQTPGTQGTGTRPAGTGTTQGPTGAGAVDTSRMTEAQKYDHYRSLIQDNGGQFRSGPNERNILSIRNETSTKANGGQGVYDDKTVMLWTDSQGNKRVREYQSNTEPSARYEGRYGEDVNGDGRRDLGRMRPGYYEFRTGRSDSLGNVLRPTQSMTVDRDTNHDGRFNDGATGSAGQSMLFHKGGNSMTGSAGCQTMPPAEYDRFWRDLNSGGNPGVIGYTLINA